MLKLQLQFFAQTCFSLLLILLGVRAKPLEPQPTLTSLQREYKRGHAAPTDLTDVLIGAASLVTLGLTVLLVSSIESPSL